MYLASHMLLTPHRHRWVAPGRVRPTAVPCAQEKGRLGIKGSEGYRTNKWNVSNIGEYSTKVTSLEMQSTDTARVCWGWSGKFGPLPASARVVSTIKLNSLTGKVIEQTDEVQLTGNVAASALYSLRKGLWGARHRARHIGGKVRFPSHAGTPARAMRAPRVRHFCGVSLPASVWAVYAGAAAVRNVQGARRCRCAGCR